MQAQLEVAARGQYRVDMRWQVRQQPGELIEGLRRSQFVQIVDDQDDGPALAGEFGKYPVDHGPAVETRCRRCRFRLTARAGGLPDCVQQGKPESLSIVLVPLHLEDGEPMLLTPTICPGPQQGRLPAAGRSRDDRDLPRRRAVEGSEKISPINQPRVVRHSPLGIRPASPVSTARESPLSGDGRSPACWRAWIRGEGRTAARDVPAIQRGDTVTSSASGANNAADLPDGPGLPRRGHESDPRPSWRNTPECWSPRTSRSSSGPRRDPPMTAPGG